MSNPKIAPKVDAALRDDAPDAYFRPTEEYEELRKNARRVECVQQMLEGLDMELWPTFVVPKDFTVDSGVLSKAGPALATAKTGKPHFRVRTAQAREVVEAIWRLLPPGAEVFYSRGAVRAAMEDKFFVDAGTEFTLGRLRAAYPRVGSVVRAPVTRAEAERALDNCGVRLDHLPDHALRPYPLLAREGEQAVTVNPRSDNGFPVLGQWATPGASEKVLRLAVAVRKEIVVAARRPGGVEEWKAQAEAERPWLVALRGKAKADYYPARKVNGAMLRFYNALPRQVMLNMQVCTQPLEALSRSVADGARTAIGHTLVHGGAAALVANLEEQLRHYGWAYVHVGDDSWVIVRAEKDLVWFALDCSNFDLTQHADATSEVHEALWRQLRQVEAAAADLWKAYMRSRLVVVAGALVRRWRHAGPSGMPLQSKVNDLLMDVLINRVLSQPHRVYSQEECDTWLQEVGQELGFAVRVEQYMRLRAATVVEALGQAPFLFIGYYFHALGAQVACCADVPRTLAQMPYPGLKWMKTDKEVAVMEAMRLGSMYLSAGVPPRALEPAFDAWRDTVVKQLTHVLEAYGDQSDERLRWAVDEGVWGPATEASLGGLLRAVKRPREVLWLEEEVELPSTSELLFPSSWADQAEAEEAEEVRRKERYLPPVAAALPPPAYIPRRDVPSHPVSFRNDGRPPPTAVWGPPRPPRAAFRPGPARRRKLQRGQVLEEESVEWEWSEEEYSD